MLSEREADILREIERELAAEAWAADPAVLRVSSERAALWTRRGYDTVVALSAVLAVTCVVLSAVGPACTAALLTGVALRARGTRFSPRFVRRLLGTCRTVWRTGVASE
jgi:hypothetical protein